MSCSQDDPRGGTPRVLLVSPTFFGYEKAMAQAFQDAGCDVTVFDERPSNRPVIKALCRVVPRIARVANRTRLGRLRSGDADDVFDLILVVKGQNVDSRCLEVLRDRNPGVVMVFYAYDTLTPDDNFHAIRRGFDSTYTFDRADAGRLPGLTFKPGFFTPEFDGGPTWDRRTFDSAFIATVDPDRHRMAGVIRGSTGRHRVLMYCPARWYLLLRRITTRSWRPIRTSDVTSAGVPRAELATIFQDSRVVIDVCKPGQTGLSMRTYEALAAGAHLLTTNRHVVDEPFYDAVHVTILDGDHRAVRQVLGARSLAGGDGANRLGPAYSIAAWVAPFVAAARSARASAVPVAS